MNAIRDFDGVVTAARSSTHHVDTSLWRVRTAVFAAVLVAFAAELFARYLHTGPTNHEILSKSISMTSLMLLCGIALYLIFLVQRHYVLKGLVVIASCSLILSESISIVRDFSVSPGAHLISGEWLRSLESLLLLFGFVLLLATFYFALLETVAVKTELRREREALYKEVVAREQAQAALKAAHDQLRRLSEYSEQLREKDRMKLAREIHDELGQALTSLKIDVANLRQQISPVAGAGHPSMGLLATISEQIDVTMKAVRRIGAELRPGVLDDLGLDAAVEWQVSEFRKRTNLTCTVDADTESAKLDRDKTTALFRMLQEALTNVARHAQATRVDVRLATQDGRVELEVTDDGRGIEHSATGKGVSFGILGIRERAELLGGELRLESEPGHGTRLAVTVPIANTGLFTSDPSNGLSDASSSHVVKGGGAWSPVHEDSL